MTTFGIAVRRGILTVHRLPWSEWTRAIGAFLLALLIVTALNIAALLFTCLITLLVGAKRVSDTTFLATWAIVLTIGFVCWKIPAWYRALIEWAQRPFDTAGKITTDLAGPDPAGGFMASANAWQDQNRNKTVVTF